MAVLRVRDTGVGLSREMLDSVFDLFMQADRSLDRSQGGLGIGLTLVRRLVELHGGTVEAHSDGPGNGSEFIVRLPALTEVPVPSVSAPAAELPSTNGVRRRALVVDDNVDAARSLAMLLKLSGHDVHTVHDGPAALEVIGEFQPDVIFLDIGLPGLDGYEIARRLRSMPEIEDVLLLALTGYGQEEDRRRSFEAGFDHHLVKPVDLGTLHAILASQPHEIIPLKGSAPVSIAR
jgi:two-component system, chemotaxis family, CheB/CheR fusion protein